MASLPLVTWLQQWEGNPSMNIVMTTVTQVLTYHFVILHAEEQLEVSLEQLVILLLLPFLLLLQ